MQHNIIFDIFFAILFVVQQPQKLEIGGWGNNKDGQAKKKRKVKYLHSLLVGPAPPTFS